MAFKLSISKFMDSFFKKGKIVVYKQIVSNFVSTGTTSLSFLDAGDIYAVDDSGIVIVAIVLV